MPKLKIIDRRDRFLLEVDEMEIPYVTTYELVRKPSGSLLLTLALAIGEAEVEIESEKKIGGVFLYSEYGKRVKTELIRSGRNQKWLINEIKRESPNCYVDDSILSKIFKGQIKNSKLIPIINKVLNI